MQDDEHQSNIPAILIAAGASKRLGQPKSLLSVGSRTLLSWAYHRLHQEGFRPLIVTRKELYDLSIKSLSDDQHVVVNEQPERGRTSSIQTGLQHLILANLSLSKGVLIVPIDRPGWPDGVLSKLAERPTSSCLSSEGRNGHPVFVHPNDVDKLLTCDHSMPLRECIEFSPFEVNAPFLHLNVDSKEDVDVLNVFYDEMQNSSSKCL